MIDAAYRVKFMGYDVETSSLAVSGAKTAWKNAIANWEDISGNVDSTREEIADALDLIESTYADYISEIEFALNQEVE